MAQVKVYGLRVHLDPIKQQLSDVIHGCVVEALGLPPDKRAHRFFPLDREDFFMPAGRSDAYLILELMMIAGRSVATQKRLIRLLFDRISAAFGISLVDLEICISESPPHAWGFRGMHGDEIQLGYRVDV
jgi:hypothetical protein